MGRSTVANYETDNRLISLTDIIHLARIFGVGLDYFGIEQNRNEIFEFISRAKILFESPNITDQEKEELHHALLKVYLEIKQTRKGE